VRAGAGPPPRILPPSVRSTSEVAAPAGERGVLALRVCRGIPVFTLYEGLGDAEAPGLGSQRN